MGWLDHHDSLRDYAILASRVGVFFASEIKLDISLFGIEVLRTRAKMAHYDLNPEHYSNNRLSTIAAIFGIFLRKRS